MCLDASVTMLPKVALIIPERKLSNLGVFVEKMQAPCLFLLPEGKEAMLALPPANTREAQHSTAGPGEWGCLQPKWLGDRTARLWMPEKILVGGDSQASMSPGGWGHPHPLSHRKVGALCCAVPSLPPPPSRGFSQPCVSG